MPVVRDRFHTTRANQGRDERHDNTAASSSPLCLILADRCTDTASRVSSLSLFPALAATPPTATITIPHEYDGVSSLDNGVTFENNTLIPGDVNAITSAKAYLAQAAHYENQFTYGWGTSNPEPMPGVYNWASLDGRVQLMKSTNATPVLTLVSAPDWMNYLARLSNTNTISAVSVTGSAVAVRLGTSIPTQNHFQDFADLAETNGTSLSQRPALPSLERVTPWS